MTFALLFAAGYLVGSFPLSYLAAKWARGIDLRKTGTGQLGPGNLWRATSWKVGLPVGLWDYAKGMLMAWLASLVGLDATYQLLVGIAVVAGHNWSVFMRFSGGRGISTTAGLILGVSLVNGLSPWIPLGSHAIVGVGTIALRSSPVPVLAGLISIPALSAFAGSPPPVTLAFAALPVVAIAKRLMGSGPAPSGATRSSVLLNRFLFDRDIRAAHSWMHRNGPGQSNGPARGPQ